MLPGSGWNRSFVEANVPYIDYNLTIAAKQKPKKNPTQFIGDAHDGNYVNVGIANILRGDLDSGFLRAVRESGHSRVTLAALARPGPGRRA